MITQFKFYAFIGLLLVTFLNTNASAFEPTTPEETAVYNARLIPSPNSVQFGRNVVVFNKNLRCELILPQSQQELDNCNENGSELKSFISDYCGIELAFSMETFESYLDNLDLDADVPIQALDFIKNLKSDSEFFEIKGSYKIVALADQKLSDDTSPEEVIMARDTSSGLLLIAASDLEGVKNAFKTLLQLSETFGVTDSIQTSARFIPELLLEDSPVLSFRGIHLCWFPETDPSRIEQAIRIAAFYKFNYAVIEFWGTFPFESNPNLYWQEFHTKKEEVRRLVQIGKREGITLIPQMNLFGHATGARVSVGKHVLLDFNPDMEPLFEPDGWTWNILNPSTRKLLTECVLELYETFDSPEFFHVGFDEAYSAGSSFLARRKGNYVEALSDWLTYFHDLLKEKNCRILMWHDMLIEPKEFQGYVSGGNQKTRGLIDLIPKDIIICDWQYGDPKVEETWPTSTYFQEKGFDFICCPWQNVKGIKSLSKNVIQKKGVGVLCTTWHTFYGATMRNILITGANSTWGSDYRGSSSEAIYAFNRHLRQASRNVQNKNYRTNGLNDLQVHKETVGP